MNREQYLKGLRRQVFVQKLCGAYQCIYLKAYLAASWNTTTKRPITDDHMIVERWVDEELKRQGVVTNLTKQKQRVIDAFTDLENKHQRASNSALKPHQDCPICGAQLEDFPYELAARTCRSCAKPIVSALDDLVSSSSDSITPEMIRRDWFSGLEDFDEAGRAESSEPSPVDPQKVRSYIEEG